MDNRCESEIINYKIISDYEKLNSFIELLPDNNKDERYMLYLFARKKYNYVEGLNADKCQLKRVMCHKKDIVKSLEQLQIEEVNSDKNELKVRFRNGQLFNQTTLTEIRERINKNL